MAQINLSITGGATGSTSSTADVSGWVGDWTLRLQVTGLADGKRALIAVEDSLDNFASDIKPPFVTSIVGPVSGGASIEQSCRGYQVPSARIGVASAKLRARVLSADAGASVNLKVLLEN